MSIRKESSGRRSIQVEVEVPGTPEEVWQAIATGPGVSSWFVPTRMEMGADGTPTRMVMNFGPGMDSTAAVTAWEPPHRFAAESNDLGPGAPPMATEWSVEARSGGVCVVRVVHGLFASTDDWDGQLEGMESGWPAFFLILKQYLSRFQGQASSAFYPMTFAAGSVSTLWTRLVAPLGLEHAAVGQEWNAAAGVPPLSGKVQLARGGNHPHLLVLLDAPAPGALLLNACAMGDQSMLSMSFYFWGDSAARSASRDEPLWQAWMKERFQVSEARPASS
jgi:uncharacterized protein YndB with AHSA1/START domain